jgi:hypothetical protein
MAIEVACNCGKRVGVNDDLAGKVIRCPACKKPVSVPIPALSGIDTSEPDDDEEPGPPKARRNLLDVMSDGMNKIAPPQPEAPGPVPKATPARPGVVASVARSLFPPDTRPLDVRRHDELIDVLKGIRFRLSWILILMVLAGVGSCTATNIYMEQGRASRSRY